MQKLMLMPMLLALVSAPAFAETGSTEPAAHTGADAVEAAPQSVGSPPIEAESELRAAEDVPHEDRGAGIMDTPLDGSSLESFNEGLERVRQEATAADFKRLEVALERLLFYDLGAKRDRELLYRRLNGRTPGEIIEKAEIR